MRFGWLRISLAVAAGCDAGAPRGPAETPPATPLAVANGAAPAAASGTVARARPRPPITGPRPLVSEARTDCLKGPELVKAWEATLASKVETKLESLGSCTKRLSKAGNAKFAFDFARDGRIDGVALSEASTDDCRALACVRRGLAKLAVPRPPDGFPTSFAFVALSPGAPPRRIEGTAFDAAPESRCVEPQSKRVAGRLPPEQIQAIVRGHYDDFKSCYEAGLAGNPNLAGRIDARFVIGQDGAVSNLSFTESTLLDCDVIECVLKGFSTLAFPPPQGGVVTVIYPIVLEPG
ncbi:MAG TPA: AgmX/PglI C-terminal domain-containing protein [Polyangiaceae bacterium]|nr:AgmX/PglI C-terminal domain-containing protein [Polyangiaceae bacterium]